MSFQKLILETDKAFGSPVTQSILSQGLEGLGIRRGDHLIVHSSLSSIGYVAGGAPIVIKCLQAVVGEQGSITMPAHTTTLTDPKYWENPPIPEHWWEVYRQEASAFHTDYTITEWMGKIPEVFRQMPDVSRSSHPAHSFASWGEKAKLIISEHPLQKSFGSNSPLGKLYQLNAKILLIGVGHDSNTSLHLSESRIPNMPNHVQGAPIFKSGVREWSVFKELCYDNEDFEKIGEAYESTHSVKKGTIGLANCKLMSMVELVDFATDWISKNRVFSE